MYAHQRNVTVVKAKEHRRSPAVRLRLPDNTHPARVGQFLHGAAQSGQAHLRRKL